MIPRFGAFVRFGGSSALPVYSNQSPLMVEFLYLQCIQHVSSARGVSELDADF